MKQALFFLVALVWALVGVAQAQETYVLLAEDFEGLPLGPNVEEALAGAAVWTDTPPAGWTVDRSGVPGIGDRATDGVTEWAGWSFTKKDWWVQTAGDQRRSEFTLGKGTVAVTDPDEWDDAGHPAGSVVGWYKTFMSTAPIDLSSTKPGTAKLKFDSSWRPEYDGDYHQTGNLTVSFDGAAPGRAVSVGVQFRQPQIQERQLHQRNHYRQRAQSRRRHEHGAGLWLVRGRQRLVVGH